MSLTEIMAELPALSIADRQFLIRQASVVAQQLQHPAVIVVNGATHIYLFPVQEGGWLAFQMIECKPMLRQPTD